jgi:uracil-DNA glycosylase
LNLEFAEHTSRAWNYVVTMNAPDTKPALVDTPPSHRLRQALVDWQDRLPESWIGSFDGVELDFDGFDAVSKAIRPEPFWPTEGTTPNGGLKSLFKPLTAMAPSAARVAIFGNDPYPEQERATGRSFEQGDLTDWCADLGKAKRVSKSLTGIAVAAAAFNPAHSSPSSVDQASRVRLRKAIRNGTSGLMSPDRCFEDWAVQGVLWLNKSLTHSTKEDMPAHRALWKPYTRRLLNVLAEQAGRRPVVVALWGNEAGKLKWKKGVGGATGRGLHFVEASHPSAGGAGFFDKGNPLAEVNKALGPGRAIAWIPNVAES